MAKLPPPPAIATLRRKRRDEDVVAVTPITALARIYRTGGRHPGSWGGFRTVGPVAAARFDTHPPQRPGVLVDRADCAVLYAGLSWQTCLAEAFQTSRVVDRRTDQPWLGVFHPTRPLRLLDLAGTWPTRCGASQAISSGPRERARAWARAIRAAYDDIDGLWYRSSMDSGNPAVCLWSGAQEAMPAAPTVTLPLDAPALVLPLARTCRRLGYRLV